MIDKYVEHIRRMPPGREALLGEQFLLHREGPLAVFFAPFDYVNEKAHVVAVGITPGWQQAEIGFRAARDALHDGATPTEACRLAKEYARFAGSMRNNLISMLDDLCLGESLGLDSVGEFFGSAGGLLHSTSAVRYPVFVDGRNYTGHKPALLKHQFLRGMVETTLANELRLLPRALVIPLGQVVGQALQHLNHLGFLSSRHVLYGFPHPSGANGHRVRQFNDHRDQLREVVKQWENAA